MYQRGRYDFIQLQNWTSPLLWISQQDIWGLVLILRCRKRAKVQRQEENPSVGVCMTPRTWGLVC